MEDDRHATRKVRVGIVGLGAVAQVHLAAYKNLPDVEIAGVVDIDPAKLDTARTALGLPTFRSLEDLLQQGRPTLVCVLTPPSQHESAVLGCAAARVHVLCEKPLALSVDACERMISACSQNNVRLAYGASYRYLEAMRVARRMIQTGELGDILLLREYAVGGAGLLSRETLGFTHYPKGGPGGSGMGLCDHGIHLIDAFAWLMGSPIEYARGRGNISGEPQHPEFAHLQFANGAIGQLLYEDGTFSTDLPHEGVFGWGGGWTVGERNPAAAGAGRWQSHPGCIHIHGAKGSLRVFYYANLLFHRNAEGISQIRVPDHPMPANFATQLAEVLTAIRENLPTPVPGEAGRDACRALLEIYASGGRVLPLADGLADRGYEARLE